MKIESTICKICRGAKIGGVTGALILHSQYHAKDSPCPYLPPEQHVHEEVSIPPQYDESFVVVATTAASIDHQLAKYKVPDPKRKGNFLYFIDVGPSTNGTT